MPSCFVCLFVCFWDKVLVCHSGWSAVTRLWLTVASTSQAQAILPPRSSYPALCSWDYTCVPPCWGDFQFFCRGEISLYCLYLSWTSDLRWSTCLSLPKCWDYGCEPPHPAYVSQVLNPAISMQRTPGAPWGHARLKHTWSLLTSINLEPVKLTVLIFSLKLPKKHVFKEKVQVHQTMTCI